MTVQSKIEVLIKGLFEINELEIERLNDDTLNIAEGVISHIIDLSLNINDVFSERGENYIKDVREYFNKLSDITEDFLLIFPKSQNLLFALKFANALTDNQLNAAVNPLHSQFEFHEETDFNGLYDSDGNRREFFSYYNNLSPTDSIYYIDATLDDFNLSNNNYDVSHELNVTIACAICGLGSAISGHKWILSHSTVANNRLDLLRYHALLSDILLTAPVKSPSYHGLEGIAGMLSSTNSYIQFTEPFEMLSEINSTRTVLDAFLSTYHSLENYMIRARIAQVECNHQAQALFSMRHFRRIYSAVDKTEQDNFKNLFQMCQTLIIGGSSLNQYVQDRVRELTRTLGPNGLLASDLVAFFNVIGAEAPSRLNNQTDGIRSVATLIYKIRCSIVHNKETEYHISNRELQYNVIFSTITVLCIPVMRRIAFGLPAVTHENPIMYSRKEISLY